MFNIFIYTLVFNLPIILHFLFVPFVLFFLFLRLLSIYRYSIVTLSWLFTITCVCVVSLGFMCPSWHNHCSCFSGCLSLPGLPKTVENDIATELEIASPRMLCWHALLQGEVRQGLVATNNLVQL